MKRILSLLLIITLLTTPLFTSFASSYSNDDFDVTVLSETTNERIVSYEDETGRYIAKFNKITNELNIKTISASSNNRSTFRAQNYSGIQQSEISIKLSQSDIEALSLTEKQYKERAKEFNNSSSISAYNGKNTTINYSTSRSNVSRQGEYLFSGTGKKFSYTQYGNGGTSPTPPRYVLFVTPQYKVGYEREYNVTYINQFMNSVDTMQSSAAGLLASGLSLGGGAGALLGAFLAGTGGLGVLIAALAAIGAAAWYKNDLVAFDNARSLAESSFNNIYLTSN